MRWHAGTFGQCRDGAGGACVQRCPCPQGQPGGRGGGAGPFSRGCRRPPMRRARCGSAGWHQVAVVLVVLGGASLVEEVGLEGGGQRQRMDLAQTLLPQGQAHRAAAEIHERQGLGWGDQGERGQLSGAAPEGSAAHANGGTAPPAFLSTHRRCMIFT